MNVQVDEESLAESSVLVQASFGDEPRPANFNLRNAT